MAADPQPRCECSHIIGAHETEKPKPCKICDCKAFKEKPYVRDA